LRHVRPVLGGKRFDKKPQSLRVAAATRKTRGAPVKTWAGLRGAETYKSTNLHWHSGCQTHQNPQQSEPYPSGGVSVPELEPEKELFCPPIPPGLQIYIAGHTAETATQKTAVRTVKRYPSMCPKWPQVAPAPLAGSLRPPLRRIFAEILWKIQSSMTPLQAPNCTSGKCKI
jgi:hypothetical protein